jgi:hypothetical protein
VIKNCVAVYEHQRLEISNCFARFEVFFTRWYTTTIKHTNTHITYTPNTNTTQNNIT